MSKQFLKDLSPLLPMLIVVGIFVAIAFSPPNFIPEGIYLLVIAFVMSYVVYLFLKFSKQGEELERYSQSLMYYQHRSSEITS